MLFCHLSVGSALSGWCDTDLSGDVVQWWNSDPVLWGSEGQHCKQVHTGCPKVHRLQSGPWDRIYSYVSCRINQIQQLWLHTWIYAFGLWVSGQQHPLHIRVPADSWQNSSQWGLEMWQGLCPARKCYKWTDNNHKSFLQECQRSWRRWDILYL